MLGRKTARKMTDRYVREPLRKAADLAMLALCIAISALIIALVRFA